MTDDIPNWDPETIQALIRVFEMNLGPPSLPDMPALFVDGWNLYRQSLLDTLRELLLLITSA